MYVPTCWTCLNKYDRQVSTKMWGNYAGTLLIDHIIADCSFDRHQRAVSFWQHLTLYLQSIVNINNRKTNHKLAIQIFLFVQN